jgi:hypothetical protein
MAVNAMLGDKKMMLFFGLFLFFSEFKNTTGMSKGYLINAL